MRAAKSSICLALIFLVAASCVHPNSPKLNHPVGCGEEAEDFVFTVEPGVVSRGESAFLVWRVPGATRISLAEASTISGNLQEIGLFGASGRLEVRPAADTTYVLTCEAGRRVSCVSASVRVRMNR